MKKIIIIFLLFIFGCGNSVCGPSYETQKEQKDLSNTDVHISGSKTPTYKPHISGL